MYRSRDTCSAWTGKSHHINRLLAGWVVLLILPVTHFAILFSLPDLFNVNFDPTATGVLRRILISISPFFAFGCFRLYEGVIHGAPRSFFSEEERSQGMVRPHLRVHVVPGILYVVISTLLLVIALYLG